MSLKPISLRLDENKLNQLDHLANEMGRSRNWALNQAIDKYLEYEVWFVQEIKAGIEESKDNNNLVDNNDVQNHLEKRLADRLDKKVDQ